MRIGFDVSPLHRPHPPGVVRATRGLVEALERRGVVEVVRLVPPDASRLRSWRQFRIGAELHERGLAGLHSPVSAFPLLGRFARVHTVHELPWRHGVAENADLAHRFWSGLATRRAGAVIAPSEFVARDLRSGPVAAGAPVRVVPWGIDACFGPAEAAPPGELVPSWGAFVLAPGAARPKKNAEALLRALAVVPKERRPGCVITGRADAADEARLRAAARELGVEEALVLAGELDDAALADAYRAARAVVVLSRSEGFAFPVFEAFASGAPVIVAAGTAQAELAGDAGIVVAADEPESVARALERAETERRVLARRGRERAARFTWDRAAELVENLWKELLP